MREWPIPLSPSGYIRYCSKSDQSPSREVMKNIVAGRPPKNLISKTHRGRLCHGLAVPVIEQPYLSRVRGKVQLIFTSPPFPLKRNKRYGNETGQDYVKWLPAFGQTFRSMLATDG